MFCLPVVVIITWNNLRNVGTEDASIKMFVVEAHLSPCLPPLLGLTNTRRGCVLGTGLICHRNKLRRNWRLSHHFTRFQEHVPEGLVHQALY